MKSKNINEDIFYSFSAVGSYAFLKSINAEHKIPHVANAKPHAQYVWQYNWNGTVFGLFCKRAVRRLGFLSTLEEEDSRSPQLLTPLCRSEVQPGIYFPERAFY